MHKAYNLYNGVKVFVIMRLLIPGFQIKFSGISTVSYWKTIEKLLPVERSELNFAKL